MALNEFMHPRNIYRARPPDFQQLSAEYADFAEHTLTDERGRVRVNFRDASSVRALSRVLLRHDFHLDVEMPLDRLIPTVPLRLNYILWLEDLVGTQRRAVSGIDIGTGASCIYPLLGARQNDWHFLATEEDAVNLEHAKRNVINNGFEDQITVVPSGGGLLRDVLASPELCDAAFDFCMCNPPFYSSALEAWGVLGSRSAGRAPPPSVSTAALGESVTPGGEVAFIRRLITESLELRERVRFFTTMIGKKSSLRPLKEELRKNGIVNFSTTNFCQGRTMRWGLVWTFDKTVVFAKSASSPAKQGRKKKPFSYEIAVDVTTTVTEAISRLALQTIKVLDDLRVPSEITSSSDAERSWLLMPRETTWTHQRRKRRHAQHAGRAHGEPGEKRCGGTEESMVAEENRDSGRCNGSGEVEGKDTKQGGDAKGSRDSGRVNGDTELEGDDTKRGVDTEGSRDSGRVNGDTELEGDDTKRGVDTEESRDSGRVNGGTEPEGDDTKQGVNTEESRDSGRVNGGAELEGDDTKQGVNTEESRDSGRVNGGAELEGDDTKQGVNTEESRDSGRVNGGAELEGDDTKQGVNTEESRDSGRVNGGAELEGGDSHNHFGVTEEDQNLGCDKGNMELDVDTEGSRDSGHVNGGAEPDEEDARNHRVDAKRGDDAATEMGDCLFTSRLTLRAVQHGSSVSVELQLVEGESREPLHQLFLFLKNKLK